MMIEATPADQKKVVRLLAAAFDTNPSVSYLLPQDSRKEARLHALLAYSFQRCLRVGKVLLTEDGLSCALFLYPEKKRQAWRSMRDDFQLIRKGRFS